MGKGYVVLVDLLSNAACLVMYVCSLYVLEFGIRQVCCCSKPSNEIGLSRSDGEISLYLTGQFRFALYASAVSYTYSLYTCFSATHYHHNQHTDIIFCSYYGALSVVLCIVKTSLKHIVLANLYTRNRKRKHYN